MQSPAEIRRGRILDAAETLFLAQGLRGTSMEAIARAAKVAKPTLYNYFADKTAVFNGVLSRRTGRWREVIDEAFAEDARAPEQVALALARKHLEIRRLLANSPYAKELYAAPEAQLHPDVVALDSHVRAQVCAAFSRDGFADPGSLTRLVLACADGIAQSATSDEALFSDIATVTQRLCRS